MTPLDLDREDNPVVLRAAIRTVAAHAATLREAGQTLISAWMEREIAPRHGKGCETIYEHHKTSIKRSLRMLRDALAVDYARTWLDRMYRLESIALAASKLAKRHEDDAAGAAVILALRGFEESHGKLLLPGTIYGKEPRA